MLNSNTIGENLSRAAAAIKVYFWQLFCMSLLYSLITYGISKLICDSQILALIVSPLVLFPLCAGMYYCHLKAIRGQKVGLSDLFAAFKSWDTFLRVFWGMFWCALWLTIWVLLMLLAVITIMWIGGIFTASWRTALTWMELAMVVCAVPLVYKLLQYSFTPLLLLDHPEVSAIDALKVSMRYTDCLKGRLLGAVLIFAALEAAAAFAFSVLFLAIDATILTSFIFFVGVIVFFAVFGVFCQLTCASFYSNVDAAFCPYRGFAQPANPWATAGYREMYQQNRSDVPPAPPKDDHQDGGY